MTIKLFLLTEKFKVEGLKQLKDLIRSMGPIVKLDMKESYFNIPLQSNLNKLENV